MKQPKSHLEELDRLGALLHETKMEATAIRTLHQMSQLLMKMIDEDHSQSQQNPSDEDPVLTLISAINEFYNSYCDVWERKWTRACKVWWALTEAILLTILDDETDLMFHFWGALRWISFAPEKRDPVEMNHLMRLFFDDRLGAYFVDYYIEDGDDPHHRVEDLRMVAREYLDLDQSRGPEKMAWLEQEISDLRDSPED